MKWHGVNVMAILRVALLGRFAVSCESRPVDLQASASRLLAYLTLSFGRMVPRSRVAGALWPDLSESRARANLSTVTWRLQTALLTHGRSATVLGRKSDSLGLDASTCDVDVEIFKRESIGPGVHLHTLDGLARAARAVDLYRGDLLEDWDEDWCLLEREQLRHRYTCTLRGLSEGFERLHRYDLALRFARKAAEVDPMSETMQRAVMRLLAMTGDRVSAVSHFNRFATLARSELGVEPSIETMALLGRIKASSARHDAVQSPEEAAMPLNVAEKVPLVGRQFECERIETFLEAALSGLGGGLLMVGEAGIGKSRLAEWAMQEWVAKGGTAALGRCIEFNAPVPYQPILDSLGSIVETDDLLGLDGHRNAGLQPPVLSQLGGTEVPEGNDSGHSRSSEKLRLFSQFRIRLVEAAHHRPTLLVVEDLQWADAGSVDLLAFLLGRLKGMRLAILLTSRPGTVSQPSSLGRLSRHCASIMHVDPLTDVGTGELVRSLLGFPGSPKAFLQWIHTETEGNPLFVVETLRLLQQQGKTLREACELVRKAEENIRPGWGPDIPHGIRSAIQQRLSLISAASLRIASIASVLGRSFDEELLAMIAGTSPNRLSKAIADLLRAGVLGREASGYRFAHDKIRAICYENLSVWVKRLHHARAASALSQIPDVPVHQLAWHRSCATQWSLAAASWEDAGDRARVICAYEDALKAYRGAVHCIRRDGTKNEQMKADAEVMLLLKSEDVLAISGRPRERRAILEAITHLSRHASLASGRSTWLARKARLEEHVGDFRLAAMLARRAWVVARLGDERTNQAESLRILAWALNRMGRCRRSLAISRLALRKLDGEVSPLAVTILWQAAASCIWLGDHPAASSLLRRARIVSAELGLPSEDPLISATQAVLDKWSGDVRSSRVGLLKALRFGEEAYDPHITARALGSLAMLDALDGRLGDAILRLRRAMVTVRSAAFARLEVSCLNEVANGVGRLLGNYSWAWNASNHALRLSRSSASNILIAMCRDSQAQLLIEEGRPAEARVAIEEALRSLESEQGSHILYPDPLARRGVVALQLGNVSEAVSDLETAHGIHLRTGERLQLVDTLTHLALACAQQGNADRAIATSDEALRLLAEIGYANMQPQRIFWHHFLILEMHNREPRIQHLRRAVEFIEERGATLSKAQQRRFRQDVPLNREILAAWQRCQQEATQQDPATPHRVTSALPPLAVRAT